MTREVLDKFEVSTHFGLSTARSVPETACLAPLLKGYPLAFVAVSSGEHLYLNEQNLPADEFLAGLANQTPDATWAGEVRSSGWDSDAVNTIVVDVLKKEGYRPSESFESPYESLSDW